MKVLVAQLCQTLRDPHERSLLGSFVHGILQARTLEWVTVPSPGDLPDPGIKPRSPTQQADPLLFEPPGKLSFSLSLHIYIYIYTHTHTHIYTYIPSLLSLLPTPAILPF